MSLAETFLGNGDDADVARAIGRLPVGNKWEAINSYGEILGLIAAVNLELRQASTAAPGGYGVRSFGDILERLEKRLEDLRAKLGAIVVALGADAFSIGLSGLSVTVSITFPAGVDADG